ncbi:MAG: hypothetical protein ACLR23_26160 [Clostridia bacterium]
MMKLLDRQAFAGSTASGIASVRTMVEVGVSLQDAITMASTTPARVIGEDRRRAGWRPVMTPILSSLTASSPLSLPWGWDKSCILS